SSISARSSPSTKTPNTCATKWRNAPSPCNPHWDTVSCPNIFMHITRIDLDNKKQVDDFLRLPFSIYRDIPQWVPPLQMDERLRLSRKRFPFYKHSYAVFFIAYQNTRPIGRLAILDNRPYNEFNHEATAFFYLFECEN